MSLIPAGKTVVIPAGTTLYRTADDICSYNPKTICNRKAECSNTGKVGIYFSRNKISQFHIMCCLCTIFY